MGDPGKPGSIDHRRMDAGQWPGLAGKMVGDRRHILGGGIGIDGNREDLLREAGQDMSEQAFGPEHCARLVAAHSLRAAAGQHDACYIGSAEREFSHHPTSNR
ncbi:hypothetical protein ACVI1T_000873 [Rhizobium redzepovicii]